MPAAPHSPVAGRLAVCARAALTAAAWVSGLVVTAWLAGRSLPPPELPPVVEEKLGHLAAHGDEYDAIFLGSSRVQFHIMPSVFDRIAAGHGLDVKTFNAGVAAMVPPEDGYMLDEIFRRPHRRLRWVIIEMASFSSRLDRARSGTVRFAYWHDWERLTLVTKRTLQQLRELQTSLRRKPWLDRMAAYSEPATQWVSHVRLFAVKVLHFGRGVPFAAHLALPAAPQHSDGAYALGKFGDGWGYSGDELQQMTGERLAEYEKAYAERLQTRSRKDSHDELSHEALDLLLAKVARAGARPILIVPPTPTKRHYFPPPARERDLTIFDFSDVREYPDLFKTENRQDVEHLNAAGAEIFSRIFAERFVAHVRSSP